MIHGRSAREGIENKPHVFQKLISYRTGFSTQIEKKLIAKWG